MKNLYFIIVDTFRMHNYKFKFNGITYLVVNSRKSNVQIIDADVSGNVHIPESIVYNGVNYKVESIGKAAFSSCYYLEKLTMPYTIKSIGKYAFENCNSLGDIKITSTKAPNIVEDVFKGLYKPKINLFIPKANLGSYLVSSIWTDFNIKFI